MSKIPFEAPEGDQLPWGERPGIKSAEPVKDPRIPGQVGERWLSDRSRKDVDSGRGAR